MSAGRQYPDRPPAVAGGAGDDLELDRGVGGRPRGHRPAGLVAGLELFPGRAGPAELLTVRRCGSYLLLRYAMRGIPHAAEPGGG